MGFSLRFSCEYEQRNRRATAKKIPIAPNPANFPADGGRGDGAQASSAELSSGD